MNNCIDILKEELKKYSIDLNIEMENKFRIYLNMLTEWNKKMNLTAIKEPEEIVIKHFLDSAILIDAANFNEKDKIIDIGTGAGFPGVPLKIIMDYIDLTLLDSLNKRLIFLEELNNKINIDAKLIHIRAEDGARKAEYREKFDKAVSRAVASLNILSEYCLPYIKVGGEFLAMKGPNAQKEVEEAHKAIEELGARIKEIKNYTLCGNNIRNIVIIEKIKKTSEIYPRSSSKISKKPL